MISATFHTALTRDALAQIAVRVDAAAPAAVEAAGRSAVVAAQAHTRVYRGTDPRAVPGRLRDSITSEVSGSTAVVGPRGEPAALYARKINRIQPFMDAGATAAEETLPDEFAKAVEAAIATVI